MVNKVYLVTPRGFCAGVEMAIKALSLSLMALGKIRLKMLYSFYIKLVMGLGRIMDLNRSMAHSKQYTPCQTTRIFIPSLV